MISPFLNQILVNFKKSNNLFFTNNDKKFTYNEAYKRLLSFNNSLKIIKMKKLHYFQINQLIIMLLFWVYSFREIHGCKFHQIYLQKN